LRLEAFKEGRVYGTLPYNYYHTNIAVALADAYYIGKVLYPDKFKDVDPEKKADEIFQVFLGKPPCASA
jgi:iron complex transport system substrate-binding protein